MNNPDPQPIIEIVKPSSDLIWKFGWEAGLVITAIFIWLMKKAILAELGKYFKNALQPTEARLIKIEKYLQIHSHDLKGEVAKRTAVLEFNDELLLKNMTLIEKTTTILDTLEAKIKKHEKENDKTN